MTDYRIVSNLDISRPGRRAREVRVVAAVDNREQAEAVLQAVVKEWLATVDWLEVFAYLDEADIAWHGYIARAIARPGQPVAIRFDNDPELRRALYEALHGDDDD